MHFTNVKTILSLTKGFHRYVAELDLHNSFQYATGLGLVFQVNIGTNAYMTFNL